MLDEDVLLSRMVDGRELADAIARACRVNRASVFVVDDMAAAPDAAAYGVSVVAQRSIHGGDYPTLVEFFPRIDGQDNRIAELSRLCQALRCNCLVDDGTPDPDQFLEVGPGGPLSLVLLDGERADQGVFEVSAVVSDLPVSKAA